MVYKEEVDALERVIGDATAEAVPLTLSLLQYITHNFSDDTEIGRGAFSVVYLGRLPNGSCIAVKRISQTFASLDDSGFHNEINITIKAAHKNIVRLIGYCSHTHEERFMAYDGGHVFAEVRQRAICLEYVPNRTLDKHITDKFQGGLDWNQRYQILKGICQALTYLHDEARIIHGDIKPSNVLLEDNFMPKLFDFGLSMYLGEDKDSYLSEDIRGTVGYMAPEACEGRFSFKTDIYSLGVTILELLTGSKGYHSVEQVLENLREGMAKDEAFSSRENKYQQVKTCLEIGYSCVDVNPDKRPTASEIIQRLDETEYAKYSVSIAHASPLWQEELDALERVIGDATAEAVPLTLPLLQYITNSFSDENKIGEGGFSVVYLGPGDFQMDHALLSKGFPSISQIWTTVNLVMKLISR